MKERLLIKCDTTIYADEITNLLIENNIVSRQHDEGQDQNPGAYGAITGIAIYVFEKDYEKAVEIINPIIDSRNESHVWCPKCGSYTSPQRLRMPAAGPVICLRSISRDTGL